MTVRILRLPPLQICLVTSGLVHLGLIGIFSLSTKITWAPAPLEVTEVRFLPAGETAVSEVPRVRTKRPSPHLPRPLEPAEIQKPKEVLTNLKESPAGVDTENAAVVREVLNPYEQEIAARLNALKRYPESARRMRQQGRVVVRFKISRDGQVLDREVVESSPHGTLNQAAEELLSRLSSFRPFPAESKVLSWVFTVPIEYRL